jgi:hypothetical protein
MHHLGHVSDVFIFVAAVGIGLAIAGLALLVADSTVMALMIAPVAIASVAVVTHWM